MTDSNQTPETSSASANPDPGVDVAARRNVGAVVAAGLALVMSTSALALAAYLWYGKFVASSKIEDDLVSTIAQMNKGDNALAERVAALEQAQKTSGDTQKVLTEALKEIRSDLGRDQTQWALSEAEHLLMIANNRLQLARDIDSAIAALRAADHQLRKLAQPRLLPVRKKIAEELSTLSTLERIDIAGMSLRLQTLAEGIDQLPMSVEIPVKTRADVAPAPVAAETPAAATEPNKDPSTPAADTPPASDQTGTRKVEITTQRRGFFSEIWDDIKDVIKIRSNVEDYKPLLAPDQIYFLRQNLRMKIYGAQHALLAGNHAIFQQAIGDARGWIAEYFDASSQAVSAALAELDALGKTEITMALPDISASLETLRKQAQQQATE